MTEVPPERGQALVEYIAHLSVEDFAAVVTHDLPALGFIPPGARACGRPRACGLLSAGPHCAALWARPYLCRRNLVNVLALAGMPSRNVTLQAYEVRP